jgi:glycosyltransferase involved in cell wall biosynthesis
MRIAQITSVYIPVPPPTHGGTEWMVYHLTEGLARRGHAVELFASGDSRVSVPLQAVVARATLTDPDMTVYLDKEYETRNTWALYRQAARFDVLHAHWPTLAPYFAQFTDRPTFLTYHYIERPLHEYYRANMPNLRPICISEAQRRMLGDPDLPVVYNGLDVSAIPFGEEADDYFVIVGRIVPNKGIGDAIRVARAAGVRLVIVGAVSSYLPWSLPYWKTQVEPFIDGDRVRWIEGLPNEETLALVSRARGFIFPLQWEEPFGLAVAEAQAAGTPVITYGKGSMPEVVEDGVTGFVVSREEEMAEAVRRIGEIDRAACRRRVEERFTLERMISAYEALYRGERTDLPRRRTAPP